MNAGGFVRKAPIDLADVREDARRDFWCKRCGDSRYRTLGDASGDIKLCEGQCKGCGFKWSRADDTRVFGQSENSATLLAMADEIEALREVADAAKSALHDYDAYCQAAGDNVVVDDAMRGLGDSLRKAGF